MRRAERFGVNVLGEAHADYVRAAAPAGADDDRLGAHVRRGRAGGRARRRRGTRTRGWRRAGA
jgi:hypothetical protein